MWCSSYVLVISIQYILMCIGKPAGTYSSWHVVHSIVWSMTYSLSMCLASIIFYNWKIWTTSEERWLMPYSLENISCPWWLEFPVFPGFSIFQKSAMQYHRRNREIWDNQGKSQLKPLEYTTFESWFQSFCCMMCNLEMVSATLWWSTPHWSRQLAPYAVVGGFCVKLIDVSWNLE